MTKPRVKVILTKTTTIYGRDSTTVSQGPKYGASSLLIWMVRIPMEDAFQLANRTVLSPSDPGYCVVTIEVFYELHCLVSRKDPTRFAPSLIHPPQNMMRKRIFWNEKMADMPDVYSLWHMDHCIDSLNTASCALAISIRLHMRGVRSTIKFYPLLNSRTHTNTSMR